MHKLIESSIGCSLPGFLTYIHDYFMAKYNGLISEGDVFEEDPDGYIGDIILFIHAKAHRNVLRHTDLSANIKQVSKNFFLTMKIF